MTFDTLALAQDLEASGLSEEQAKGLARALQKHWRRNPGLDATPARAGGYIPGEIFTEVIDRTGTRLIGWLVALMVPLYVLLAVLIVGVFSR